MSFSSLADETGTIPSPLRVLSTVSVMPSDSSFPGFTEFLHMLLLISTLLNIEGNHLQISAVRLCEALSSLVLSPETLAALVSPD